jgi:hypothetical protein
MSIQLTNRIYLAAYVVCSLKADLSSVSQRNFQRSRNEPGDFFFIGMTFAGRNHGVPVLKLAGGYSPV